MNQLGKYKSNHTPKYKPKTTRDIFRLLNEINQAEPDSYIERLVHSVDIIEPLPTDTMGMTRLYRELWNFAATKHEKVSPEWKIGKTEPLSNNVSAKYYETNAIHIEELVESKIYTVRIDVRPTKHQFYLRFYSDSIEFIPVLSDYYLTVTDLYYLIQACNLEVLPFAIELL